MTRSPAQRPQRGVATLVMVGAVFFILALVAGYTNRNLLFDQRTASQQVRSTVALEAAEAGAEWALALLNSGRVADDCRPTDDPAAGSFRTRFLALEPSGHWVPRADRPFACVSQGGGGWTCDCASGTAGALSAPAGDRSFPAFRGRFLAGSRPGLVTLQVQGCNRLEEGCQADAQAPRLREASASLEVLLALRSAVPAPPAAAITVHGNLSGPGTLHAYSPDAAWGSFAVLAGGSVTVSHLQVGSAAGSPEEASALVRATDPVLSSQVPNGERMFASTFLVWPALFRDQPATVSLACAQGCSGDDVRRVVERHPGRVIWISGRVVLDGADAIGSSAAPVVIVIEGEPRIETPLSGLLYLRPSRADGQAAPIALAGDGHITGALVVEGSLDVLGDLTVVHDHEVLDALRHSTGSFVRVPGGWADFTR